MQKITVEIVANNFTGLTAENIEKALDHYFGSPTLHVSFSVTESRPTPRPADGAEYVPYSNHAQDVYVKNVLPPFPPRR